MQIMSLVERSRTRCCVRVEVDDCSHYSDVRLREELHPARMTRGYEILEPRRGPRETVRQAGPYLAAAGDRETLRVLGIVIQDAEDSAQCRRAGRQIPAKPVQNQHRVIAVGSRLYAIYG